MTIKITEGELLLIDKSVDWTSFDAVNFVRRLAREQTGNKGIRVGHAGTLDPFATGLLLIAIGRASTKHLDDFKNLPKTYEAQIFLGATSDSGDPTGIITSHTMANETATSPAYWESKGVKLDLPTIQKTLATFLGPQTQIPPMHSAKIIDGQRLYKLARQGKTIERKPNPITIYDLQLLNFTWPILTIQVTCSAGTYIRTLAEDIGAKIGPGAYCTALRRLKIGDYDVKNAIILPSRAERQKKEGALPDVII